MNDTLLAGIGRSWWVLVLYGVIAILFGLSALFWPAATIPALAWAIGIMAIAEGVASVFALFDKTVPVSRGWLGLYAVVSIAFGLVAVFFPLATAGVLLLFLAAWLIVAGIYRIAFAIRLRKVLQNEWLLILSGVLAIILGALFVGYPGAGLLTAIWWIGLMALVYGVLQVWVGWRVRKLLPAG